ncbi:helix-turn-helix domain-containing protein [Streptomyces virginiae]|uniref:helix-turn-helix domain-containing protein n=1 Tax=Streptomyces virginiae TaxID=1961 RepID=UPI00225B5321|nr:helix-turn-helix domain-containing protein [Streptomyces virginiae]MCX4961302.1 helix-turn-helix domain-containing protein [Streptomyces virginiae]MCX5180753.1 helix-turn-helix domain-containing protein [Streptomyces virginiae]
MFTKSWQRPIILATASLALVTGTACAAQASQSHTPTNISASAPADQPEHCVGFGAGGKGGEGGKGGRGGEPGQPGEPGRPGGVGCFKFEDLPDKSKADLTVVDKVRIAIIVLAADDEDETTKKIADKYKISEKQIDTWKKYYVDGDWFALMADDVRS